MLISNAFAQAAPAAATGAGSGFLGLMPILLMFVVLYFLMIRPQMKRQKELRAMIEALSAGDEVITVGGVVGRITKLGDQYITIEISDSPVVQVISQRGAVTTLLPKGTIKTL